MIIFNQLEVFMEQLTKTAQEVVKKKKGRKRKELRKDILD